MQMLVFYLYKPILKLWELSFAEHLPIYKLLMQKKLDQGMLLYQSFD